MEQGSSVQRPTRGMSWRIQEKGDVAARNAVRRALVVMLATLLIVGSHSVDALATHNQWSHCNVNPRWYAEQETSGLYTGILGRLYTYQPSVPGLE